MQPGASYDHPTGPCGVARRRGRACCPRPESRWLRRRDLGAVLPLLLNVEAAARFFAEQPGVQHPAQDSVGTACVWKIDASVAATSSAHRRPIQSIGQRAIGMPNRASRHQCPRRMRVAEQVNRPRRGRAEMRLTRKPGLSPRDRHFADFWRSAGWRRVVSESVVSPVIIPLNGIDGQELKQWMPMTRAGFWCRAQVRDGRRKCLWQGSRVGRGFHRGGEDALFRSIF